MKYYESLLKQGSFSREQLIQIVKKENIANNIIYEYQKRGLIEQVKRDYYVVISLETKQPLLSKYQIGINMFSDACLSHHSAFEVYGYANQVLYDCFIATDKRFSDFEYNGITYHRIERKSNLDMVFEGGIRCTSIEQTVIDSIKDYEKIVGLEEVIRCLVLIPGLNEKNMLACLERYHNGFLYQKCGYIFSELNDEFQFSSLFFDECKKHSSKAKRYLIKNSKENYYQDQWKLYTPRTLRLIINKGVEDLSAIG